MVRYIPNPQPNYQYQYDYQYQYPQMSQYRPQLPPQLICPPQPMYCPPPQPQWGGFQEMFAPMFMMMQQLMMRLFQQLQCLKPPKQDDDGCLPCGNNGNTSTDCPGNIAETAALIRDGEKFVVKFKTGLESADGDIVDDNDPLGDMLTGKSYKVEYNEATKTWKTTGYSESEKVVVTREIEADKEIEDGEIQLFKGLSICKKENGKILVYETRNDETKVVGEMNFIS